jgi:pentatricopeptide repeat protein
MEAMKEGGVRPDVVTYTALIAAYAKDNNFAAADQVRGSRGGLEGV